MVPDVPRWKMLRFPNARLLIHNLIAERKLSGEDALAAGACELGLMSPIDMEVVRGQSAAQSELCGCSHTAKLILKRYFDTSGNSPPGAFEKSWETLQERSNKKLSIAAPGLNAPTTPDPGGSQCAQHAPIIFDYLLQEVNRHS